MVNGSKSRSVHRLGYAETRVEFVVYHGDLTDLDSTDPDVICIRSCANYSTGSGKGESVNCIAAYRHVDKDGNAS